MIQDFLAASLQAIRYGCWHDKPSNGHCCFVYCPNSVRRRS
jgi:hypothetical protein